jgi:Beta propeller domain
MGPKLSTDLEGNTDDEVETQTDEENGDADIISRLSSKPQSTWPQTKDLPRQFKKIMFVVLTVIALVVLVVTPPFVFKKPSPEDPENTGPDVEFGETPSSHVRYEEYRDNASAPPSLLPFDNVDLPYFDKEILSGYANETDFEKYLAEAAKFLVNKVVLRNLGSVNPSAIVSVDHNDFAWRGTTTQDRQEPQQVYDVTEYETNNQQHGIDKADLMKSDDNYVYAAYSNYVLVWDKNGNQVAQVKMSLNDGSDGSSGGGGDRSTRNLVSYQQPQIESLLLVGDQLVVIVSGHNSVQSTGWTTVLTSRLGTQIRTYATSSIATDGKLVLVGTKEVNGHFLDAQSVGAQVHIATISSIDTYTYLVAPFERLINYPELNDWEYVAHVRRQATEKYIPEFVQKLKVEIMYRDPSGNFVLPNLLRVNQWQALAVLKDSQSNESYSEVNAHMFEGGVVNSFVLITSFDVTAAPRVESSRLSHELLTTTAAFFNPSQHARFYGSSSHIVVATRSFSWNSHERAVEEVTQLVVLTIDKNTSDERVSTAFQSVGTVRGYVLNPYSLDIVGNRLRVAATVARRWRSQGRWQLSSNSLTLGDSHHMADVSDRSAGDEDGSLIQDLVTDNYISVLELDNELRELGVVQLGKENEVIMSVRFFDDIAYCETFERTDPFYVVDLNTVQILGSFVLNGFSHYLHPLNEDGTLLVGIGQNATSDGVVSGFIITVFNVTNPTMPEALVSYTVDDSPSESGTITQSASQWDYKSFRYVDGKLIVPLDVVTYTTEGSTADSFRQSVVGTFDGFIVFNVRPEIIEEHFRVSHVSTSCHHCGSLAPRSFVYHGNVMTAEGNIVSSTNLVEKEEHWAFLVDVRGEAATCCV